MELRKDPITRSWVITGDEPSGIQAEGKACRYCQGSDAALQVVSSMPPVAGDAGTWSARAVVHPTPLYRVEGEPMRRADGIYDRMRSVGAHEVLIENPHHARQLWNAGPEEIRQFLELIARRIMDLKQDRRFKYVTVFKDYGDSAGQEFEHATSQVVATTFVPRRVLYELRAGREYFAQKERCVFCDILAQEQRQAIRLVESRGDYLALCPYAPRVPFETWIMPQTHEAAYERMALARPDTLTELAILLRSTLRKVLTVATAFHLVLHTSPNTLHRSSILGYWKTIDDDYHWHIEIMPVLSGKVRSYTAKETYYSPVSSETAAAKLREARAEEEGRGDRYSD